MTKCWETLARSWGSFLFQVLFTSSHDIAGQGVPSWEPLNWIYVLMRYALKSEEHHIKTIVFELQACCKPFARSPEAWRPLQLSKPLSAHLPSRRVPTTPRGKHTSQGVLSSYQHCGTCWGNGLRVGKIPQSPRWLVNDFLAHERIQNLLKGFFFSKGRCWRRS